MAIVQCRACKQKFNREKLQRDIDWVMPSRNYYYHKNCYENWKKDRNNLKANKADEEWIAYIYDFLGRDLKVSYDYRKCESQRENFVKSKQCTNKGIFFALKYYYEIKKEDWSKSRQGIGIVPYIYEESTEYWKQETLRRDGLLEMIERQMKERANRPTIHIDRARKKKEIWQPNWEEIEAFVEDE